MAHCSRKVGLAEQICSNSQPNQAPLLPSATQHVVQGFNNKQEEPRPLRRLKFSLTAALALVAVFVTISAAALFVCNSHFAGPQHLVVQMCQPCSSDSQCGLVARSIVAPGDHLAALLFGSNLTTHTPAQCRAGFCVPDGEVDPLAACTRIPAEQQRLERLPLAMAQFASRKLLQEARTDIRMFARNIARQTRAQLAVKDSNELFADYFRARSLREDGPSHSYLRVNTHGMQ